MVCFVCLSENRVERGGRLVAYSPTNPPGSVVKRRFENIVIELGTLEASLLSNNLNLQDRQYFLKSCLSCQKFNPTVKLDCQL
jgi:hypothetical protein